MERTDPFWLFDRSQAGHLWEMAFREMGSVDPDRHWAVAANWKMDHRVSPDREAGDLMAFPPFTSVTDAKSWLRALDLYYREEVCQPASVSIGAKTSAYIRATNTGNLLPSRIAGFDRLVHVGSLNAMAARIQHLPVRTMVNLQIQDISQELALPAANIGSGSTEFNARILALAQGLVRRGARIVRQVSRLLADALGDTEPPWWACYEHEIREVLDSGDPENLGAALGLGHYDSGQCLLVWVYRVDDVGPFFRPTVADSLASPYHFPSPPDYEMGITMPLKAGLPACREMLHPPLKGSLAESRCTGEILFLSQSLSQESQQLAASRSRHWERLKEEFYTDDLEAWGSRHPERT